jgi:DNA-binding MarR family transcriptional regulator
MTPVPTIERAPLPDVTTHYLETIRLVEDLRYRLHQSIKNRLEQMAAPLTAIQALMLYNIGDRQVTYSELHTRRYYLGENASHNFKKLVTRGYLERWRSEEDGRVVWLKLSDKGHDVADAVRTLLERQARMISPTGLSTVDLAAMNTSMNRIVTLLVHQVAYRL